MIQLTAEIDIFSQDNGEIQSISLDEKTSAFDTPIGANNVSAPFTKMLNKKTTSSANPFILGVSNLGDGSALFDEVDYFISDILFNENGELPESPNDYITLHIFGDIKSATIVFDTINGGYPTGIDVDGKPVSDDDPAFTISDTTTINFWQDGVRDHTIGIWGWNKPNRPLVIQGVYITPRTLKIGRRNIVSLERSIIDRSDLKLPSWGIISNGGSLEFNDPNGEIKDYAEQGLLKDGQKAQLFIFDTLSNLKQKVGDFITYNWNYDTQNKKATVTLKDNLEELQDLPPIEIELNPKNPKTLTMAQIYGRIMTLPEKYNATDISKLDIETKDILNNTNITHPYYNREGSLWAQIYDFCAANMLYMYKNQNGELVCQYYEG